MKNNNSKSKKYDSDRETRVLLEKIHSDVKTIAEGQASNSERLMRIENVVTELVTLKSDVNTIKIAVMDTNQRVKALEEKVFV